MIEGFASEALLCSAFLDWVARHHPTIRCYAECGGWDILLVYPDGRQIGVQAKLRLNADVILQAAPDPMSWSDTGPDYRAVLVPKLNGYSALAERLGLVVFSPHGRVGNMAPPLNWDHRWIDWNPTQRHHVPATATDSIAGSPCPVTLTRWKESALRVLAVLELTGRISTKRMKTLGVDHRRWVTAGWLKAEGSERGLWVLGGYPPPFAAQHPSAYAAALEEIAAQPTAAEKAS